MTNLRNYLHRLHKPERYRYLHDLLETEKLTPQQLVRKQQRDLQKIIKYAVKYCLFYQDKYKQFISDDEGFIDPAVLPVLQKEEVIRFKDSMLADNVDRSQVKIAHTSGSTGKPLAYYYNDQKTELMRAGMCRSYMWSGWRPGQKILNFWGARQDIKAGTLTGKIKDYMAAEKTLPAHKFDEARLYQWVKLVQQYKPVLLQGYASILAELAHFIIDQNLQMPSTIVGAYSTAEVLTERQRELMQQAFNCRIFNQYGSREIPNMAVECLHGNQHVLTDMVYMEPLGNGPEQQLIVTSLTNTHMPFIRYKIGDSAVLKPGLCSCGSPFPMMEMGVCRSNDMIKSSSGKQFNPAYFHHLLDGVPGINQYQFVQNKLDRITLNFQSANALSAEQKQALTQRIKQDIDSKMTLQFRQQDNIERTASGKHRFVIREFE